MPPLARLNRKIQNKIQVNSIIQKSLRRNGNTGQDFAPLVRKIGGLDSVPAPNPAAGERDKREVVIVNHFLIFQSMDSALNLLSQHLME